MKLQIDGIYYNGNNYNEVAEYLSDDYSVAKYIQSDADAIIIIKNDNTAIAYPNTFISKGNNGKVYMFHNVLQYVNYDIVE